MRSARLTAERITIEADEQGFELHILDDEGDWHAFNIHGCALEFHDEVRAKIGEWAAEAGAARRAVAAGVSLEEFIGAAPDESEPLLELADHRRKADRERA